MKTDFYYYIISIKDNPVKDEVHAMRYEMDLKEYQPSSRYSLGEDFSGSSANGDAISFNNYFMEKNGRPFFAVSGESHYSRMDRPEE